MSQQSIQALINDLRSAKKFLMPDWRKRIDAAEQLGELKATLATNDLAAVIEENKNPELCQVAIRALGQIGDDQAVAALIGSWEQAAADQHDAIGRALIGQGTERVIGPLVMAQGHPSATVREQAAGVLQRLGSVTPRLMAMLGDQDPRMREGARTLLAQAGAQAVPDLLAILGQAKGQVRESIVSTLEQIGEPAVEPLINALSDSDSHLRMGAADALAAIGDPAVGVLTSVLAQWQKEKAVPRAPVVKPDGSGDFATLAEAVGSVSPGAVIRLTEGTYHLESPLLIESSLILLGEGMDGTRVVCEGEKYVVRFVGEGGFAASGVTFEYVGENGADAVQIATSEITLRQCRFTGGNQVLDEIGMQALFIGSMADTDPWRTVDSVFGVPTMQDVMDAVAQATPEQLREISFFVGNGLHLMGQTTGVVADCEFVQNRLSGILVSENAQPTLEGNVCRENGDSGTTFLDSAAGYVRKNRLVRNKQHGIQVHQQAQPALEENTCQENGGIGIAYFDSSEGSARQNTCAANSVGIGVDGEAQPTLNDNVCRENQHTGILMTGRARPTLLKNACRGNTFGIRVQQAAQPTLDGNACETNTQVGIVYGGLALGMAQNNRCTGGGIGIAIVEQAKPTLEGNLCRKNQQGIFVDDEAQPVLAENTCRDNETSGIVICGSAGGTTRRNECMANGYHGIEVSGQARPLLEGNKCEGNEKCGIIYLGLAGGTAQKNECIGNGIGIYVEATAHPLLKGNQCRRNKDRDEYHER